MRRLGSPYSRCTDGAVSVDVPLLYNSSYTRQVSLGEAKARMSEACVRRQTPLMSPLCPRPA